ncbi:hypothetical protein SALBM311S_09570 [Streptomyces alboniger]
MRGTYWERGAIPGGEVDPANPGEVDACRISTTAAGCLWTTGSPVSGDLAAWLCDSSNAFHAVPAHTGLGRRGARRARPRAARGGHRAARAGVRAGGRRHRAESAGDHPSHRIRGAGRASSRLPACWPSPSPTGPPGRCAAGCASSGRRASRRARSTRPHCGSSSTSGRKPSAGPCPGSSTARSSSSRTRPPPAASVWTGASCGTSPARSKWSKVTQTVPADYALAAAKAGREAPRAAAEIAQLYAAYEDLKRERVRHRLRGRAAADRGRPPGPAGCRRPGPFAVPALRGRRVPGRQPPPAAPAGAVARAAGTTCAWSATPARRSTRSPEQLPTICSTPAPATPGRRSSSWSATTRLPTPQVVHLANGLLAQARGRAADHRLELVSQRRPGPRARLQRVPRRARRGRGRRPADTRAHGRGRPGQRDRHPVPHQLPVRDLRTGPRRRRSPLPVAGRRALLRPPRGPQGRCRPARRGPLRRQRLPRRRHRFALPGVCGAFRRGLDHRATGRLRSRQRALGVPRGLREPRAGLRRRQTRRHPR